MGLSCVFRPEIACLHLLSCVQQFFKENAELWWSLASEVAACHRRNTTSVGQSASSWCYAGFPLNILLVLDDGKGQEVQGLG